jgi:hypothetical protein
MGKLMRNEEAEGEDARVVNKDSGIGELMCNKAAGGEDARVVNKDSGIGELMRNEAAEGEDARVDNRDSGMGELMRNEAAEGEDARVDACERKLRRSAPNFDLIDLAAVPDTRRRVPVAPATTFDGPVTGKTLI